MGLSREQLEDILDELGGLRYDCEAELTSSERAMVDQKALWTLVNLAHHYLQKDLGLDKEGLKKMEEEAAKMPEYILDKALSERRKRIENKTV